MSRPKASKKHTRQAEVSEVSSSQAFPAFQGTFDEQMRELFRAKRLAVGLSMQQLGEFLKIHWSTLRKWEAGITERCRSKYVLRVAEFLDGVYDRELRRMYGTQISALSRRRSDSEHLLAGLEVLPASVKKTLMQGLETLIERTVGDFLRKQNAPASGEK